MKDENTIKMALPMTAAGKIQLVYDLMHVKVIDDNGNPVLDEYGNEVTESLISKEDAYRILNEK